MAKKAKVAVKTAEQLTAEAAEQEAFGGIGGGEEPATRTEKPEEVTEEVESSVATDTMWNSTYFEKPMWTSIAPKIQALVVGINPATKNQGKTKAYRFVLKNIKVLTGDPDAARKIKNHFIDYNYKTEGGRCGWTYGLRSARTAGAQTAKDIVGKVCIFDRAWVDFNSDTISFAETRPTSTDSRALIVPMMLISSIEGLG